MKTSATTTLWTRATRPRHPMMALLALFTVSLLLMAAGDTSARFNDLGHRLMCTCGCNQILLECNHVGCTVSDTMRKELAGFLDRGDNDSLVLQNFVQKYGATVIAAPPTAGFGWVAWITPFAVLALATWLVVMVVKKWQRRPAAATSSTAAEFLGRQEVEALRARAREETQI